MVAPITQLQRRLAEILPADAFSVDPKTLENNSDDYAWFSNILEETLDGYRAEAVAWPGSNEQLAATLATAYDLRIPVTLRGGGTGNYGQCVPLHGGLVINTNKMNRIVEMGEGFATVQAGVKIVELDRAAQATGQEVRIFPSTYLTATVVGFVGGGSGGIGSIRHGMLVDGNVLATTVYPCDATPTAQTICGSDLLLYIHAYGTTGVMADVTVPLTPQQSWEQAVYSFSEMNACHAFCRELQERDELALRLICSAEPAVVRYFMRARLPFATERTAVLLVYATPHSDEIARLALQHGGQRDMLIGPESKTRLTDFSWNHTTLWAKKADPSMTYLQCGWDVARFEEQYAAIKDRYGDDFALHAEYARLGGGPFLGSLPLMPYRGRQEMAEMISFLESVGVSVANPHTYILEEGSRTYNAQELLRTKQRNDPANLLNPGKLAAASEGAVLSGRQSSMGLARHRRALSDLEG